MAGFHPFRTEGGATGGEVRDFIIENSATITIGDDVDVTAGYVGLTGATARSMGIVQGFVKDLGNGTRVPLDQDAAGSISATRSGNAGVVGSDTVAVASDNQTVDKIMARVVIDPSMEYYNDADGSLTQAMIGTYFNNVSASDQISQSSSAVFDEANATEQWILMQIDPFNDGDASKGIFRKVKSQLAG